MKIDLGREATVKTLGDACDSLPSGSVEAIFLAHAMTHCFETWLSESYGVPVVLSADEDGFVLLRTKGLAS